MGAAIRERKVGLIGTGYWSEHHLNAWQRIPGVKISALCNRSTEKLEQRGRQFDVPKSELYSRIDDLLERADIDILDIVTGPETHPELVAKAAKAGKHIMCQKPFAASLEDAREMVRTANENGVRLMVTENWRWLQPNQILKQALEERLTGEIRTVRYIHTDFYTPRMALGVKLPQPFFRQMPRLLFYEMGAHWFDTVRFLFGDPKRLYAETLSISPYITGEDSGIVMLGYDGFYVVMDMSWATRRELEKPPAANVQAEHREQMVIEGNEGTLKLYMNGKITLTDNEGFERILASRTTLDHAESHYRLQNHFIDALHNGLPFQTSGEDNLKTLELIFSTYESAEGHRVIHFS